MPDQPEGPTWEELDAMVARPQFDDDGQGLEYEPEPARIDGESEVRP
jgi:hypothetical protein